MFFLSTMYSPHCWKCYLDTFDLELDRVANVPGGSALVPLIPCSSLSVYCTATLLVFLCLLSFPDQSDSCSH